MLPIRPVPLAVACQATDEAFSPQFPDGVDVFFDNAKIAVIDLPPICSPGGQGVPDYETTGTLTITDQGGFTNFASYLLNNPSFTWVITTNTLRVRPLCPLALTPSSSAFCRISLRTITNAFVSPFTSHRSRRFRCVLTFETGLRVVLKC